MTDIGEKRERLIGGGVSGEPASPSDEYEAAGYLDFYNDIDARIAEEIPCPQCGGHCSYRGLRDPHTGTYRAFGICGECKHEAEF